MLGIAIIKRLSGGITGGGGGGGGAGVNLLDASVAGIRNAQWTLGADGYTYKKNTSGAAVRDIVWISPQSGMSDFEVQATVSSGSTPDGTLGSFLNAGVDNAWGWTAETDELSCNLLVEIRRASDSVVVDTATISLSTSGTSFDPGTL